MSRSYKHIRADLVRQLNRRPKPPVVLAVVGLLTVLSIIQINGAQDPRHHPSQALALSLAQAPPDSQNLPSPKPKAVRKLVPIAGPWQGPTEPVIIKRSHRSPVFERLPITEPVVFLGIDDGWFQSSENLEWLKIHHLPFSLFVVDAQIRNNYDYFRQLQAAGMIIEDHSVTHPDFTGLTIEDQQNQICDAADKYGKVFGRRPAFFRPPYGAYNRLTQRAAHACGIKAIINWDVVLQDGAIQYQTPRTHLKPGDIILTHFQTDLMDNMQALSVELQRDHLQLGRLEDWLR